MEKMKNVPEIRFNGFESEWEETFMGDLYNFQYGYFNNNPSNGGKYPIYGANGVIGGFTDYNSEDAVVIGHMGEYAGVVLWANGKHFVTYNGIITKPASESLDAKFGYFLLKKENIRKICGGSGQPFLSYDMLNKIATFYPSRISEQIKISDFFQNLDNSIKNHNTQLKKLTNLKKAMLIKMFPQDGASVPEIRFKGFDGEWEEKSLGTLGKVAMNKRIFKNETSKKEEIPFYKIGTFGGKPDAFISRKLFKEYKRLYPYPQVGDLLISASGSIGRVVEYKGEDEYFQDSNIVWLDHEGNIDNSFLKQYYSFVKWEGLEGSTIKRLYNRNILETKIFTPALDEQKKIGNYFKNLDDLIENHKEQLKKLNQIKKACLSKLFVSQD